MLQYSHNTYVNSYHIDLGHKGFCFLELIPEKKHYICIYEIFIEAILSNKLVFNMEDSKPKKIISKTSDILDKKFEYSQTMFKNS